MSFTPWIAVTLGGIGGIAATALFIAMQREFFPHWLPYLWPGSILLGATFGNEGSLGAMIIVAVAILSNVLLFSGAGAAVGIIIDMFRSLARK